jgi:hypothetical protein
MKKISQIGIKLFTTLTISLSLVNFQIIPSNSQDSENAFSGQNIPLTLTLKDLNSTWRKVSISGQFEMGDLLKSWTGFFNSLLGTTSYNNVYYTQGKTVTMGNQVYLIAYRIPLNFKAIGFEDLLNFASPSKMCQEGNLPVRLTQNTKVNLALLNFNSAGSFNDLISVNINEEIAESDRNYQNVIKACEQARLEEINKEAQGVMGTINRGQQAYYLESSSFTDSWEDLSLGLNQETESYRYSLENGNNDSVFSYAIPKKNDFHSYVGVVFYDSLSSMTYSTICKSMEKTTQKLAKPTLIDYQFNCPANSVAVD